MVMNCAEIARLYRTAKNPSKQIKVLCELNNCTTEEIVEALIQAGENVEGTKKRKIRVPSDVLKVLEKRLDNLDAKIEIMERLIKEYEKEYRMAAELFKQMEVDDE